MRVFSDRLRYLLLALSSLCVFVSSPCTGWAQGGILLEVPAQKETVLYETDSEYYRISVTQDALYRRMFLNNTAQGTILRTDPTKPVTSFAQSAFTALAFVPAPMDILVIGLGPATMPNFLQAHYPDARIDVVELDAKVLDTASDFFGFKPDGNLRAYVDDGRVFLRRTKKLYDIIILDAYQGDYIPFHLCTVEFLSLAKSRLKPGGLVAANIWAQRFNELFEAQKKTFQSAFKGFYIFTDEAGDNFFFIGTQSDGIKDRDELTATAEALIAEKGFSFDLAGLVRRHYNFASGDDVNAKPLTDDHAPVNILRHRFTGEAK